MRFSSNRGRVLAVSSPDPSFQRNAQAEIHRTIGDGVVSEKDLEKTLSGMVAATAVPGASYEWQSEGARQGGYVVKFAERPTDRVLVRISGQYDVSPGEPSRFGLRLSTALIPSNAYKTRILSAANLGYDPTLQLEAFTTVRREPVLYRVSVLWRKNTLQQLHRAGPPKRHSRSGRRSSLRGDRDLALCSASVRWPRWVRLVQSHGGR